MGYPIGVDADNRGDIGLTSAAYSPQGIPSVYIVGPTGRIVFQSNEIEDAGKELAKLLWGKVEPRLWRRTTVPIVSGSHGLTPEGSRRTASRGRRPKERTRSQECTSWRGARIDHVFDLHEHPLSRRICNPPTRR